MRTAPMRWPSVISVRSNSQVGRGPPGAPAFAAGSDSAARSSFSASRRPASVAVPAALPSAPAGPFPNERCAESSDRSFVRSRESLRPLAADPGGGRGLGAAPSSESDASLSDDDAATAAAATAAAAAAAAGRVDGALRSASLDDDDSSLGGDACSSNGADPATSVLGSESGGTFGGMASDGTASGGTVGMPGSGSTAGCNSGPALEVVASEGAAPPPPSPHSIGPAAANTDADADADTAAAAAAADAGLAAPPLARGLAEWHSSPRAACVCSPRGARYEAAPARQALRADAGAIPAATAAAAAAAACLRALALPAPARPLKPPLPSSVLMAELEVETVRPWRGRLPECGPAP